MLKNLVITRLLACLVASALAAPVAIAAEDWPRVEVADLTGQLVSSLQAIAGQADDGSSQPEALQEKNFHAALVELRQLIIDTRKLETMLIDGDNMHQTLPRYRQLTKLRKSVRYYAENTIIGADIRQQADITISLFERLDDYYK